MRRRWLRRWRLTYEADLQGGLAIDIQIIEQPVRFRLHGLSATVDNHRYGEVGCRLMDEMWRIVKGARVNNTGVNHWVYFADERMFVGVEVRDAEQAVIPAPLEACEFELPRYAKHLHVGPYHELPRKWQLLKAALVERGESVTMPSLEVYGHSCEGADESQAETTILLRLAPKRG